MDGLETVTVLFTDLVGSTSMSARVGPTAADELRGEYFAVLREAIGDTGGREVKNTGDGVMAVFGSATGAVECAVAIQQSVDRRNARADERLGVRVGVNLGEATVEDGDYFGLAVTMAARLCDAAGDGQILVSDIVRAMVAARGEHVFKPVGELELKGLPEPTPAFEVDWQPLPPDSARVPLPARLAQPPPTGYVGRGDERGQLASLYATAAGGGRQVALLSGEPGIGKTRLASYAALAAREQGAIVLYGRCDEELGLPHGPWLEALRHLVEHAPQEVLDRHVERHGGDLGRLLPELGQRVAGAPAPRETDPETERYLMWGAVAGLIEGASQEAPIVLVLDDLHWADRPSLALLRHLVTGAPQARLLLIGTYRESDLGRDHPLTAVLADLRREQGVERIALSGLDPESVVALMEATAGHELDDTGRGLADEIVEETGGNPFFVAELLRHLAETGAIFQDAEGRWSLHGTLPELGLPQSVREVIDRRVERLGGDAARVLGVGAVIGREFDLDLLARATGSAEDDLLDLLDAAVGASLLVESAERPGRFSFSHALINHTLYEALGATRRARLHGRVAESLEEICGDDVSERLGELAQHWAAATAATNADKVVRYARAAAQKALADLAPAEALRWFEQALELADGDPRERCDLLIGLGEAMRQLGDPGYRQTLIDAALLARDTGDADRLAQAALGNTRGEVSVYGRVDHQRVELIETALELLPADDKARRARLKSLLALELSYETDRTRRDALSEQALALARESGDQRALAHVLHELWLATQGPDTLDSRRAAAAELRDLAARLADPELRYWGEWLTVIGAGEAGDGDQLDQALDAGWAIAGEIGRPSLVWTATIGRSNRARVLGRFDEAERLAFASAETGEPDAPMVAGALIFALRLDQGRGGEVNDAVVQAMRDNEGISGWRPAAALTLLQAGREDEARTLLDREDFGAIPRDAVWKYTMGLWAWAACELAASGPARAIYELIEPLADGVVYTMPGAPNSFAHFLGGLATLSGNLDAAIPHFERSLQIAERMSAPVWKAQTQLYYARALRERDPDRARALAEDAAARARDIGARRIADQAESALRDRAPL